MLSVYITGAIVSYFCAHDSKSFFNYLYGFAPWIYRRTDGTMLESSEGGVSWQTLLTGSSTPLADINFPAFSIGYADGNGGVIIKTSNAGNTSVICLQPPMCCVVSLS